MNGVIDNATIGRKIREFRQQAGFTQERLAEALGITFQQVQKFEKGITKVNLLKLQQLSYILKVPISAFFSDCNFSAFQLEEEEKNLIKSFRKISTNHRQNILEIVESLARLKNQL